MSAAVHAETQEIPKGIAATNPLAVGTTPITVASSVGQPTQVQGLVPGLAITPEVAAAVDARRPRFRLTHVPTGLGASTPRCGEHIEEVAQKAVDSGIDWTANQEDVVAAMKAVGLNKVLVEVGLCGGRCAGDEPEQPTWGVRCTTCDWQWEGDDHEGPLDPKQAKEMARDHECEPHVEILAPSSDLWLPPYMVGDDGSVNDPWRPSVVDAQPAGGVL